MRQFQKWSELINSLYHDLEVVCSLLFAMSLMWLLSLGYQYAYKRYNLNASVFHFRKPALIGWVTSIKTIWLKTTVGNFIVSQALIPKFLLLSFSISAPTVFETRKMIDFCRFESAVANGPYRLGWNWSEDHQDCCLRSPFQDRKLFLEIS